MLSCCWLVALRLACYYEHRQEARKKGDENLLGDEAYVWIKYIFMIGNLVAPGCKMVKVNELPELKPLSD